MDETRTRMTREDWLKEVDDFALEYMGTTKACTWVCTSSILILALAIFFGLFV